MTTPITGETWGDEIDSVRAHLLRESEQPLSALRPQFEEAHRALSAAVSGVSEAQAEFRPATGEGEDAWGIAEVLRHLASIEVMMASRIQSLGSGNPPNLRATYPGFMEDIHTRKLPELIAALDGSQAA